MYKRQIYGYLFYPKAEGKYTVVLCPPGAGIKTIKGPMRHRYYAEEGCIRSVSYTHLDVYKRQVVTPRKDGVEVDLKELVDELQLRDVSAPMLVRFPDILDNRRCV